MARATHLWSASLENGSLENSGWESSHWHRRVGVAVVSALCASGLRAWQASWRITVDDRARLEHLLHQGRPIVAVFWHGAYLPLIALLAGRAALVVSSRSFRGAVIAGIARRLGYRSVQAGGASASTQRLLRQELSRPDGLVAIAVDGPLGPRHRVKPGAIRLAAHCGARIVTVHARATRAVELRSRWDHLCLPLPASAVCLCVGRALDIEDDSPAGIERARVAVQASLDALESV